MNVNLPTDDSDTLGGFIYTELGKVPVVGDRVSFQDLTFTVESVAGRRIKKVRIEKSPVLLACEQDREEHSLSASDGGTNDNDRRRWKP
jgi:Mg2+/Co2+ transporter CorC